jgi:hypothetical protein
VRVLGSGVPGLFFLGIDNGGYRSAMSNSRLDFCQTGESGAVAPSLGNFTPLNGGKSMRDVRDNLQRRANVLDQPSNATLAESGAPQTVAQTRRPAWLERAGTKLMPDHDMRDIRADLQERTKFLEEQIEAARAQFDTIFARLKQEHDIKVDDLKKELDAVLVVNGFEDRRFGDTASSAQDVGAVVEGRALRRA